MEVARGQKFCSARGDPPFPSSRLTLWAVPIAATVIRDGAMSTAGALIDMAAECGGATARNGQQDFDMRPADPLAGAAEENKPPGAGQGGQPPERPAHLILRLLTFFFLLPNPRDPRWSLYRL